MMPALVTGCDSAQDHPADAKLTAQPVDGALVRLTADESSRAGIVVQPATRREYRTFRDFPGTVKPDQHALAEITALVRGRVVDVYADLGKEVKTGELLAILYSGELGMAQSSYLKAKARLYVAERASQRAKLLLKEKVIGLAEGQRREGEMISTRAEKREAHDRLLLLGMSEEDIQRLDREQKIQSYVPILAPFDGRIILRNLTKGEVIETTERLFQVADLSEVWVVANIPEKDVSFVHHDQSAHPQKVEVHLTAYPGKQFEGAITYVGDVLDPATRTMQLRLELPNPKRTLKPEMYATIRIYADAEAGVLAVPETAVQREKDKRFVFVQQEPDSFEMREITVGESDGQVVKVLDGLREGEQVVTKGAFILKSEAHGEQL